MPGADLRDALDYPRDRLFRQWAVAGDEPVGQAQKNSVVARIEPKLGDGLSRFVFPQLPQPSPRVCLAGGMRTGSVADDDYADRSTLCVRLRDQSAAGEALVVGMWRDDHDTAIAEPLR